MKKNIKAFLPLILSAVMGIGISIYAKEFIKWENIPLIFSSAALIILPFTFCCALTGKSKKGAVIKGTVGLVTGAGILLGLTFVVNNIIFEAKKPETAITIIISLLILLTAAVIIRFYIANRNSLKRCLSLILSLVIAFSGVFGLAFMWGSCTFDGEINIENTEPHKFVKLDALTSQEEPYRYLSSDSSSSYEPLYFPKPKQPDLLYVVDKQNLTNYEKILLASLQGITAKDKPCIWISGNGESYDMWLQQIQNEFGVKLSPQTSAYDVLDKVSDSATGYILYDLSDGTSLNVATSLAGIYRAFLVDKRIEQSIKDMGYTCVLDTCGLDDQWLYDNYKDKFGQGDKLLNNKIMLEQRALENDERYYTLRDYAIFCNMATVYQSTSPLMDSFLQLQEDDSILLGWGDGDTYGEDNLGIIAAKNGTMRVASDWASNLTVLSAFYPDDVFPQKTETNPETLETENKHYVTFIWTDGDNIQWTCLNFANDTAFWSSESRGKFNLGWGINNLLYEVAPTTLEYYYRTAADNENGKDYFVVGPHYAYAKSFYPTLPKWTEHLNTLMGKTGLKYVQVIEPDDTIQNQTEAFDDYTEHENIHGLFYLDYSKYDKWNGKIVWSNGKPVVSARYAIWDPNQMSDANPDDICKKLQNAVVDPTSPDGYSFITVHAWSGYTTDDLYKLVQELPDNIKVVTPDEFMQQIEKNIPHG